MENNFSKSRIALTAFAALGTGTLATAPTVVMAAKTPGTYVAGDFHNHTTCSDGSTSMQKLVKKSTDKTTDSPWGLDWFVQAGHGGQGNRNCTLVEDASLATPAYPYYGGVGPNTTWQNTPAAAGGPIQPKGTVSGTPPSQNMWRLQSIQEFQYPLIEYLNAYKDLPLFLGIETVVPGHEHTSMSVITGQIPAGMTNPGDATAYAPVGTGTALAQWEYCFDRNDSDRSRGNATVGTTFVEGGNNWTCEIPGNANSTSATIGWNATAQKLIVASGTGSGDRGHQKSVVALQWMAQDAYKNQSYYAPAHLERSGPFNPNGNNGFNVEHLRDFNNTAPNVAFGFETQPGHHASDQRGEYTIRRNNFGTTASPNYIDSVGGTTYGGTGVYGAQIGGVWDALLGEGRNWWFFASSDWHNRGDFGPDERQSTQDFYPGEYQRNYTLVRTGSVPKPTPQMVVDGLRTGNNWTASGQLIDRMAFIACASYAGPAKRSPASVESLAVNAALNDTGIDDVSGCATMGEKLTVRPGAEIVVSIVVRDPAGTNYSPYTFPNPSLKQAGVNITQPLNQPVLDHVDVIRGMVTSTPKKPGDANYSGQWPNDWINPYLTGGAPSLSTVPAAAKNTTAALYKTFNSGTWQPVLGNNEYKAMTFRIPAVSASQYVRLRGTNLPANVPYETDANGNPLPDIFTNQAPVRFVNSSGTEFVGGNFLSIPCTTPHSVGSQFDGCPDHMATAAGASPISGQKGSSFDVAAWADLWFYSNPIYVQVNGSTVVAGVK